MDQNVLKVIHLAAAFGVFSAIGAVCLGGSKKASSILHGISLLLLLLVGFAMLRKPPMELHWWKVKLGLWLVLGALPAIAKHIPKGVALAIGIVCGVAAAWLGHYQPF